MQNESDWFGLTQNDSNTILSIQMRYLVYMHHVYQVLLSINPYVHSTTHPLPGTFFCFTFFAGSGHP